MSILYVKKLQSDKWSLGSGSQKLWSLANLFCAILLKPYKLETFYTTFWIPEVLLYILNSSMTFILMDTCFNVIGLKPHPL